MVHTPSSSGSLEINNEFRERYPIGTILEIGTEGKSKQYQCTIDSYGVLFWSKVQVGVKVVQSWEKEEKIGIITMDSEGKPALYFFDEKKLLLRKKEAIITSIRRSPRPAQETVTKNVEKVHTVVAWNNKAEVHA